MSKVKIYWPEGSLPYTSSGVEFTNAVIHIAAHDRLADDAQVLLDAYAAVADEDFELPDGYEWDNTRL
jgi:hypothetical protein